MTAFKLVYGDGPTPGEGSSVDELDAILDQATAQAQEDCPYGVYIVGPEGWDGPMLGLGIGREHSFLTYGRWYVQGDLDGGKPTQWWYGNDFGYSSPNRGIPVDVAREAAREFVRTGRRPTNVEWVEDDG